MYVKITYAYVIFNNNTRRLKIKYPTRVPCVKPDMVKGADLKLPSGREELIKAQKSDTELINVCDKALSVEEADKVPVCYFVEDSVLMRKYRPPGIPASDEFKVFIQILVPNTGQRFWR